MTRLFNSVTLALSSGLYLSYVPGYLFRKWPYTGAGLIGTLWGVAVWKILPSDPVRELAVWLGVFLLSVAVSDAAEELMGRKDDPRIVIDEVIGYLTAMLLLPRSWPVAIAGFLLFRILDVSKPGWIKSASKLPGGWGVVVDDLLAGVVANVLLRAAHLFYPF